MKNFLLKFKRPKYYIPLIVLVLVAVGWLMSRGSGEGQFESQAVVRGEVSQIVSETGITQAAREVDLQFEQSGRITNLPVAVGDLVSAGAVLARIDSAEQYANFLSAQANLRSEQATLANLLANASGAGRSGSDLSTTQAQQEVLVANAYAKLLSEGLVVEPSSDSYTQTAPTVSGRYTGPEGTYKIIVKRGDQYTDYIINVFGIETVRDVDIAETGPTPLGTYGLYLTFPDSISSYVDTIWYVTIPNTESTSYLSNYNAYVAAKEGASVTVTQTGATTEEIAAQQARVDQAAANLEAAEATLSKRTIYAPFAGIVTAVEVTLGETVSANAPAVSLISNDNFEIELDIPEADIANIEIGDLAEVTFDAYDDARFEAEVVSIAPAATLVEGVPSFETILRFTSEDDRLRSGLSADVDIMAASQNDVLYIPSRALFGRDGETYVRVVKSSDPLAIEERRVVTSLRGSLGTIEVVEGLEEGEEVITFISEEVLNSLQDN